MLLATRFPRQAWAFGRLPGAITRAASCIDLDLGANDGNAAGVELDKAAAYLEGDFATGFEYRFLARLDMQFPPLSLSQACPARICIVPSTFKCWAPSVCSNGGDAPCGARRCRSR
ncbi:hypothetical protein [Halomonas sp. PA16-9]|uniref:hypothetical protein n=1 Tax=Halomonas sp. PA16-9 TaxID=2576841 RepID=UPI0030ED5D03